MKNAEPFERGGKGESSLKLLFRLTQIKINLKSMRNTYRKNLKKLIFNKILWYINHFNQASKFEN
jgi:hypothetical protein